MILVTGATGTMGRALARRLQAARLPWRACVRQPSRVEAEPPGGAFAADLDDAGALRPALAGATALFLLAKPSPSQPDKEARVAALARDAGVERILRMSVMAADPAAASPVRAWHGQAAIAVAGSGLPTASLAANFFMQSLAAFEGGIRARGRFSVPAGEAAVSMVDVDDLADAALRLLTAPEPPTGTFTLTGPQSLTFDMVAARIGAVLDRPVAYRHVDPDEFRARLVQGGSPAWHADAITALYADFRAGVNAPTHEDLGRILGRTPSGLDAMLAGSSFARGASGD